MLLYAVLSMRRNGAPTFWETCAAVLPRTNESDVVAVTPAGSYLARRLREEVAEHRLFLHRPAELPELGGSTRIVELGVRVALADKDRDRHAAHASCWPPIPTSSQLRLRCIDTLYADSHNVKLVVLDCPTSGSAVLRGARRLLDKHQPTVVVDFTAVPICMRKAIWEDCVAAVGAGYDWRDGMLLPCNTPERRAMSLFNCANSIACALPDDVGRLNPPPSEAMLDQSLSGLSILARANWKDSVPSDPARFAGLAVPFDSDLPNANFHAAETAGSGIWWRWTGPAARSKFAMPIPGPGRWNLRFQVINWGVVKEPRDVRIHVAGQTSMPCRFDTDSITWGPLTVPVAHAASSLWVQIVTSPTMQASDEDMRWIGINFSQCTLEPA